MKKAAVVILNWNGRDFLARFLPFVVTHSTEDADIVVIDNGSTDDSVVFLTQNFPSVFIVRNEENLGFAGGYNEGLKQIRNDYYILLNSDVEVTEGWLKPILSHMDCQPTVVACQPLLRAFHDRESFEYAGGAGGYIDRLGYPFCRGRLFQHLEKDEGQYNDLREIFWATGACMFIRRSAFEEAGGFDAGFFAHMEEIDLCWRLKNMGYKVIVVPGSVVYHVGGGTLPRKSSRKTYLNMRNNGLMLIKNLPLHRLPWVLTIRFVLDIAAAFKFLVDGGWGDFWAVFRAHGNILASFPTTLARRRNLQHQKVSSIYNRSIVWDYFVKGIRKFSQLSPDDFSK